MSMLPPAAPKRTADEADGSGEPAEKRPRPAPEAEPTAADEEDDFDALLDGAGEDILADVAMPPEPADEVARRTFAEKLTEFKRVADEVELQGLLATLQKEAHSWLPLRRWRSSSLLLVCVARSSRIVRAAFISEGLSLLGAVLQESVGTLETGEAADRQEAGMWALACLMCLRALSLGRATLWEHRQTLGKPFDRLHRWCGKEKSALAAELRAPTSALCRRWRRQPKPAGQEVAPEQRAVRSKVVEIIQQGLMGISGAASPASPAPLTAASPGAMPNRLVAAEVEAALFGRFGSASHEYKQHARMLRSNLALAGNAKLRERVLAGDTTPEELAAMTSAELAPDALREQRRLAKEQAMKELVVEEMLPRLPSKGEGSPGRDAYTWSTAPPVFMKSPQRLGSSDSVDVSRASSAASQKEPPPLVPPPTPFQDIGGAGSRPHDGVEHHDHMEVLPTPAPDDEDEEQESLIQYLAKPVRT